MATILYKFGLNPEKMQQGKMSINFTKEEIEYEGFQKRIESMLRNIINNDYLISDIKVEHDI